MAKCCENGKQHWQMDLGSQSIWPWWPKDDSEDEERADEEPVAKKPRKKCSSFRARYGKVNSSGLWYFLSDASLRAKIVENIWYQEIVLEIFWKTLENHIISIYFYNTIYYAVIIRVSFFWFLSVWRDKIWFAHLARQCNIYNLENSKNCRWVARLYGMVAKVWMTCMTVRYHVKGLTKRSNLGDLV